MVTNLAANAGDAGDMGLNPRSARSPGVGSALSTILPWKVPRTEEPVGLQSMGSQRIKHNQACTRVCVTTVTFFVVLFFFHSSEDG